MTAYPDGVRIVGLVVLVGCSALIPPRMWHPPGWQAEEGRPGCPSYAYPTIDLAFGVPMLALGVVGAIVATEPPSTNQNLAGALAEGTVERGAIAATVLGLTAGVAWTASSIYGYTNEQICHRELGDP